MADKQCLLHGAVVLFVGLLCGAPMGSAIARNKPEPTVRGWRVAHSSLVAGGILLLAIAGVVSRLALPPAALVALVASFIAGSYAFCISLPLGAHLGVRGLSRDGSVLGGFVYVTNIVGVAGLLLGGILLVWGAIAAQAQ